VVRKRLIGKVSNQLHCLKGIGLSKSPLTQAESKELHGMEMSQEKQTAVTIASQKIPVIFGMGRCL